MLFRSLLNAQSPKTHTASRPPVLFFFVFSEKRRSEAARVLKKYPDRVPVICERAESEKSMPEVDKKKYLLPADLTVGQFQCLIQKRIELPPEKSFTLFCQNSIPPMSALMTSVYEDWKDDDGFLYVRYSGQNTFGGGGSDSHGGGDGGTTIE